MSERAKLPYSSAQSLHLFPILLVLAVQVPKTAWGKCQGLWDDGEVGSKARDQLSTAPLLCSRPCLYPRGSAGALPIIGFFSITVLVSV